MTTNHGVRPFEVAYTRRMPPAEIRRRVEYFDGFLYWRESPARGYSVGDLLYTQDNGNGYVYTVLNREKHAVHRIVWFLCWDYFPEEIDHVNCDKTDNRIENLRATSRELNQRNVGIKHNNTSGFKGVGWHKCKSRWRAYIAVDGRHISLGYYNSPLEAHKAYCDAAIKYHGDYARVA